MRWGSLAALLLLAASGCTDTTPVCSAAAVWSDDAAAVLVVLNHGLQSPGWYGHVDYEPDRWEMFIHDPATGTRTRFASGEGEVSNPFYFMRSSGSVVAVVRDGDDRWHMGRLGLDGGTRSAGMMGPGGVVPSPDGSLVALPQNSCEGGDDAVYRCRGWVDFFDADTFELVGSSGDIEYSYNAGDPYGRVFIALMWSPDGGTLYAQEHDAREGVRRTLALAPGEPPRGAELPCIIADHPATSSSDVAADGRVVRVDSMEGCGLTVSVVSGEGPGYPGRCF